MTWCGMDVCNMGCITWFSKYDCSFVALVGIKDGAYFGLVCNI